MIRVLIRAVSAVMKVRLADLLRGAPQFQVIDEPSREPDPAESLGPEWEPDVILAEAEREEDVGALYDPVEEGVPLVLLVPPPTNGWGDAFLHGARAVLPNTSSGTQVAAAIEAVAAGLAVFDPSEMEDQAPLRILNDSVGELQEPLTTREIEVLRAMAEGLANKEIAARLGISENTVKFHVGSVMGKLAARSRTEAVTLGIRHGIVLI